MELPTCSGLDGKHVAIRYLDGDGPTFFNFKRYQSTVLSAMVDANYKFRWVNVSEPGEYSDVQIWNHGEFKERIQGGIFGIPPSQPHPRDDC